MAVDMAVARRNLELREERKRNDWERLRQRANADADKIISMIVEHYSPLRIYQWGSVLSSGLFRDYSDIDIAVEGLVGPLDVLNILRDAEDLTQFPIHIVELDKTEHVHAESIRRKGALIYERKSTGQ